MSLSSSLLGYARRYLLAAAVITLVVSAVNPVRAGASTDETWWYAYPNGEAVDPESCPQATDLAQACTLTDALALVPPGGTVLLDADPGAEDDATFDAAAAGGWTIRAGDLTIEPAPGVNAFLDGEGSALYILKHIESGTLTVHDITIQNASTPSNYGGGIWNESSLVVSDSRFVSNNTSGGKSSGGIGGGIMNRADGTVTVFRSQFLANNSRGILGGGITSLSGSVTVSDSLFQSNYTISAIYGGGIFTQGPLTVTRSVFAQNVTQSEQGGGIAVNEGTPINITDSMFVGNDTIASNSLGGGISARGSNPATPPLITIIGSTFSSNNTSAANGGGIYLSNYAAATISESTFDSNNTTGGYGGGINIGSHATATVVGSTFTGNLGGGIRTGFADYANTRREIAGSIFAGNTPDCVFGEQATLLTDRGYNIASDATCQFDAGTSTNSSADLLDAMMPLARYGGPTDTRPPNDDAPVVGAIPAETTVSIKGENATLCPRVDQRGAPSSGDCTIGAVEREKIPQSVTFTSTAPSDAAIGDTYTPAAEATSGLPVTFSIDASSDAGACGISAGIVTFTGGGHCVIGADQSGDDNYAAGAHAFQSVTVVAPQPPQPPQSPQPSGEPADSSVCTAAPFADVSVAQEFCPEISWLKMQHITKGFADGGFHPAVPVTRQAMAAFLYRMQNPGASAPACTAAPFTDVLVAQEFCPEISWLKAQHITKGFADGGFHPAESVTRQAMAAFLYRMQTL